MTKFSFSSVVFFLATWAALALELDLERGSAQIFLSEFPSIVVATNNSNGQGYIAATLDILEGLEDLGYKGQIILDLDYFVDLRILAPELAQNPRYSFQSISRFLQGGQARKQLVLSGAAGAYYHYNQKTDLMVKINLQPSFWNQPQLIKINVPNTSMENILESNMSRYSYFVRSRSKAELINYTNLHARDVANVIERLLNNPLPPWSLAYGFGVSGAARLARFATALGSRSGPITIALVSKLRSEERDFLKLKFDEYSSEKAKKIQLVIASPENYEEALSNATENTVIILTLGPIPQFLFKGLMEHSTLPVVVAGTGALNQARVLAKPHLVTRTQPYDAQNNLASLRTFMRMSKLREFEVGTAIKDTEEAFEALSDDWENPMATEEISKFIDSALDPESPYSRVLRDASTEYRKCNLLVAALAKAAQLTGDLRKPKRRAVAKIQ